MPASGHQDHTTSPSALALFVKSAIRVHRIPRPTSVTIAKRPSCRGGTAGISNAVSTKPRSEIFFADGVDRGATQRGVICPIGKSGRLFVTTGQASPYVGFAASPRIHTADHVRYSPTAIKFRRAAK